MESEKLSQNQILSIRKDLVSFSFQLLGVKYEFGAECKSFDTIPSSIDCSEVVELVYNHFKLKMPDGSQNQYNFTVSTPTPQIGDLAFFGRDGNFSKVYHVGLVFDDENILEARAYDPSRSFETGKVILRPKQKWENYKNFLGYRAHPKFLVV